MCILKDPNGWMDPSNDLFASFFKSMDVSFSCICWMVSMKDLKLLLNPKSSRYLTLKESFNFNEN